MASNLPGSPTTGYKLLPSDSDSLDLPPPDYNDVVSTPPGTEIQETGPRQQGGIIPHAAGSQPSAPPLSELELVAAENPPSRTLAAGTGGGGQSQRGTTSTDYGTGSQNRRRDSIDGPKSHRGIQTYVSYSIPMKLRKYINPPFPAEDPELDVEAQFASHVVRQAQKRIEKKQRLQCLSGWLWCFGVILVIALLVLPVGMIAIGIAGVDECPHRSNTIIIYLLAGGFLMAGLIFFRIVPSVATCCKNKDACRTKTSAGCSGCICVFELVFYSLLLLSLVTVFLGTYWIFDGSKPEACSESSDENECCSEYVYLCSAIFNIVQYVLYALCALYTLVSVVCVRGMHKVMSQ